MQKKKKSYDMQTKLPKKAKKNKQKKTQNQKCSLSFSPPVSLLLKKTAHRSTGVVLRFEPGSLRPQTPPLARYWARRTPVVQRFTGCLGNEAERGRRNQAEVAAQARGPHNRQKTRGTGARTFHRRKNRHTLSAYFQRSGRPRGRDLCAPAAP